MIVLLITSAILTLAVWIVIMDRICEEITSDMAQANADLKKQLVELEKSVKKEADDAKD